MMTALRRAHACIVAACGLLAAAAATEYAAAAPTLAVAENAYAAPALIAEREGYFAAEGLTLTVLHCPIGRVCLQHLLEGRAQYATVADTPITMASLVRRDFGIAATMSRSDRDVAMLARADHGITSPTDLRGKRIGVIRGTSAHYFAEIFLRFHGLLPSQVSFVWLEPADPIGPLERGEIDAASLFDPHGRDAQRRLGSVLRALPVPGFFAVTFNLVAAAPAAGATDDDLVKLLRALRRAVELIRTEPARARAIVAAATRIDASALADSWGGFEFRLELGQPLVHLLEAQARWAQREQLAPGASVPDYLDLIRAEPLRRVDPRAVKLVY